VVVGLLVGVVAPEEAAEAVVKVGTAEVLLGWRCLLSEGLDGLAAPTVRRRVANVTSSMLLSTVPEEGWVLVPVLDAGSGLDLDLDLDLGPRSGEELLGSSIIIISRGGMGLGWSEGYFCQ